MSVYGIYKSIKDCYYEVTKIWFHKYKVDLGISVKWSIWDKLKYNWLGFTDEDFQNFDLKKNDYREYISFRERWRLENINGRFAFFLGEKLMFERIFGQYINVPHINCWIKNGICIDIETGEKVDILQIAKKKINLIAKPTRSGGGGAGVNKISVKDQKFYINENEVSTVDFMKTVATWEEYIIVDFIDQAEYSSLIYPETTNSMRIITAKRKNGNLEIVLAFHRFGSDLSKPVDNISRGGLVSLVDISSGRLGQAKRKTEVKVMHSVHPDSDARIEGVLIPNWENVKEKLLQVHRCFPFYTFLAWDVVIDVHGVPCVLEINRGSDLGIQMVQSMRNEKLGEFMREYGLLDKR